jgi:aminoglycoside phosphotransferase (APT) family kinase protein
VVVGVDDWGHASQSGDPLRDLGRFAVRLADRRLAEVVAGRTSYARTVRRLVAAGLERTALPPQLWRDVLVLAQLELAVESLDRGDPSAFSLLLTAVRALPGER